VNTEDIREGAIYRTMEAYWTVKQIADGRVRIERDRDLRIADLLLGHFAQIAEMEVRVKEPTDVVVG